MADNSIRRWLRIIFDRPAAKKAEGEMASSLGAAGKKGGENFLRELRAAFDKKMATLRVQLAKGLIDQKAFKAQADLAAKTFNTGIIAGMEKARAAGKLTDSEYLKLSRTLKKVGTDGATAGTLVGRTFARVAAGAAAFFGVRSITRGLSESVHAALEAEDSVSRLDTVLQTLGLTYRDVAPQVEKYLDNLQKTTRFSDEDGRAALAALITITGDYGKALSLMDVTAKIAEKRQTTMAVAAETAGKASLGLTKGMIDLGIKTNETGDIVGKINRNLGDLAVEGGKTSSGSLAILRNLLGEVKESFGNAVLGSDQFKGSIGDLRTALIDLNTWVKDNGGTIRDFVGLLIAGARGIGQAIAAGGTIQGSINRRILAEQQDAKDALEAPAKAAAQRVADQMAFTQGLMRDIAGKGKALRRTLTKEEEEEEEERKKKATARAKELGAELQRIEEDIAVARLQIEQNLTEALAREMVRRKRLLAGTPDRESATPGQVGAAAAQRDKLQTAVGVLADSGAPDRLAQDMSDVGVKAGSAIPPMQEMTRELFIQKSVAEAAAEGMGALAAQTAELAGQQWDNAQKFSTPWTEALSKIGDDANKMSGLFGQIADIWAEGGIAGLAKMAKFKVLEMAASAIESAANAFKSFAAGNFWSGAQYTLAAAKFTVSAVHWAKVAKGGGAGASGTSSAGGASGSAPSNLSRSSNTEKAAPEVHLYFRGPKAFSPEMERFVYTNMQNAREKFGDNAKIHIHRDP